MRSQERHSEEIWNAPLPSVLQGDRFRTWIQEVFLGDEVLQDPLNDAMVMMKNAETGGKGECRVRPASKLIGRVLKVMQDHDYIAGFEYTDDGKGGFYQVRLKGSINDCGVIKPRSSVRRNDLEKWEARYLPAQDFGLLILTTTEGVISQAAAKERGVGGKLLAYVY